MKLYPPGHEELQAPAEQERGAEIRRRLQAALEPAEALAAHRLEEIGRLEDVLRVDRIAREERPVPTAILDPGIPSRYAPWPPPRSLP